MTKRELKRRLDKIASEILELNNDLAAQYGEGAKLYFEAEGSIYAMKPEPESHMRRNTNTSDRQSLIIESSDWCGFDCGAW